MLQHGRLVAAVDYHLTIPHETHFIINPTGRLHFDYDDHLGGFILVAPEDAGQIVVEAEYTLEMANKHKKTLQVERRYKKIKRKGKERISFWVRVVRPG